MAEGGVDPFGDLPVLEGVRETRNSLGRGSFGEVIEVSSYNSHVLIYLAMANELARALSTVMGSELAQYSYTVHW